MRPFQDKHRQQHVLVNNGRYLWLQAFDQLMLMRLGGRIVYNGPVGKAARELRSYFGAVPGVRGLPVNGNPATWVLQSTSQAEEERLGVDFAAIYAASPAQRQVLMKAADSGNVLGLA